jgi:hypothetical protein
MKRLIKFEDFPVNESFSPMDDLVIGGIYHMVGQNTSGEDVSADYEYLGPVGGYDFKFRIVKSYMGEETRKRYDELGLGHWHEIGFEFTLTSQAVKYYVENGKMRMIESSLESAKSLLSLAELKKKYPEAVLTMKPSKSKAFRGSYNVKAEIKTQGGKIEYLGALKGPVSKDQALEFLNAIIDKNYDRYY